MKMIGITGGKGGTGKSTVATGLAHELAKKSRVLLVDADVDCPNDHLLLSIRRVFLENVEQRIPRWDFEKCTKCSLCGSVCKSNAIVSVSGKDPIFMKQQCNGCGACVLKCPEGAISWDRKEIGQVFEGKGHGIDFLSGELKANEPISEFVVNALNVIVEKKKNEYDYVVIDTSAGTHCPVIAALGMCDVAYAVTEPTPLGSHDLKLILDLLRKMKVRSGIILNRSDIGDKKTVQKLSDEYHTGIVAEIPYSREIIDQYSGGVPVSGDFIKRIADEL